MHISGSPPFSEDEIQGLFQDFQGPYQFSRTFQAWNFNLQIQGLSRIFKDRGDPDIYYSEKFLSER